jgi:hypothetical protein
MIMVGFFEDLSSERAIAARCADSMSIRAFLKWIFREFSGLLGRKGAFRMKIMGAGLISC